MNLRSSHNDPELAQHDHPCYDEIDVLRITSHVWQEVDHRPCERILLPRPDPWPSHHIGGHVGRSSDGTLHATLGGQSGMYWRSRDDGASWQGRGLDVAGVGAFAVLDDDTLLVACGGGSAPIQILRSVDFGDTWTSLSQISAGLFDALHIDSNLLQLRDGTVLLAVNLRIDPPAGAPFSEGIYPQYLFRSSDGGATWSGGGDVGFWQAVKRGEAQVHDDGPEYSWPGEGGTFPGVYETGFAELRDGRVLGAFRFSGPPRPWHHEVISGWGEPPADPDDHGRIFRHVVLGESHDGGRSWHGLRPVLDAEGKPLLAHGECNGELVELSDGRLVLVHQTRYAESPDAARGLFRGRSTLSARLSQDSGTTWEPVRYRVLYGFGYPGSLVLPDDTIVTVVGACLGDNGDPRRAAVVRWKP